MEQRISEVIQKKRVHEILDAVLDCNGLYPRQQKVSGVMPTVFLDFFGHTGDVDVYIHEDGWSMDNTPSRRWEFSLSEPIDPEEIEDMKAYFTTALGDKTAKDVLMRELEEQEKRLAEQTDRVDDIKKRLAELEQ